MTVKQIASAVGKDERSIQRWIKALSDKVSPINDKMSSSSPMKPADYDLTETCQIIEEGLGKAAADVYRTNAVNDRLFAVHSKPVTLPSGAQLQQLVKVYGPREAGRRIDYCIGYTASTQEQKQKEKITAVPPEQGLLAFESIKAKFSEAAK
jgi:hypothetical protein